MRVACPACGRLNDEAEGAGCRRCGCDLSRLLALLHSASRHLEASATELRKQNWDIALEHAAQSWRLKKSAEAARLAFLATAALGATEEAASWREAADLIAPTES